MKRIIGIDVARALAVIGMIIVNFKIVLGAQGDPWLKNITRLFDGKAAATFVVLAGIGLALTTRTALKNKDVSKLNAAKRSILKRAIFLFIIGLSYGWIWPADILHFHGVYMLLTLLFIYREPSQLLVVTTVMILLFPVAMTFWDYETGWNFKTLEYHGFWTWEGFLTNLFYNGFHPVIPWSAFMFFGLWYGRQSLYDHEFVKRSLWVSLLVFIVVQVVSMGLIQWLSGGDPQAATTLESLLGTAPMPPMPIYMLNGISIATAIISSCILLARRYENSPIVRALEKTGQLALTFYVAHVVIGMGIIEGISPVKLGAYSTRFSLAYALLFSLCCILFANVWLKHKKMGPVEWIMRKVTG